MELNGAALNVNKPRITSQKTAFRKDNKAVEYEYQEKLWLPNLLVFINLISSKLFIIREPRKKPKLKCHL